MRKGPICAQGVGSRSGGAASARGGVADWEEDCEGDAESSRPGQADEASAHGEHPEDRDGEDRVEQWEDARQRAEYGPDQRRGREAAQNGD